MAESDLAPVTYGAYDHRHMTVTLDTDSPAIDGWIGLNMTVEPRNGATRAGLTLQFYNMAGDIYANATDPPFDDIPLDTEVHLHRDLTVMQANNETYDAAPGTSRIEINSVYWGDENWEIVHAAEGDSAWSWFAVIGDVAAPPTAVPV